MVPREKVEKLVEAMKSIADNSCCEPCREAKLVATKALIEFAIHPDGKDENGGT